MQQTLFEIPSRFIYLFIYIYLYLFVQRTPLALLPTSARW